MTSGEEHEIMKALDAYLHSIMTGEEQYFKRAFYSDSMVINGNENNPAKAIMPIAAFAKRIQQRVADGLKSQETPQGLNIDYVGNIANVRIDFQLEIGDQVHFGSDFINLVKRDGTWKIAQKLYYVTRTELARK